MNVSNRELVELIREIEREDPIDYADLPYAEDDLRLLVCNQMREIDERARQLGQAAHQRVLLAVAAKLVLENMVLHLRLMKKEGQAPESIDELIERLRRGPS